MQIVCDNITNIQQPLHEMKRRALVYRDDFYSESGMTVGHITYYAPHGDTIGNFVLVPGVASNTDIEPLMQLTTWYALSNRYGVYCLDSFLGDFGATVSTDAARRNTYRELCSLVSRGLNRIEAECSGKWSCVTCHSAGATASMNAFNNRVSQSRPFNFSSMIMFAPYLKSKHFERIKQLWIKYYKLSGLDVQPMAVAPFDDNPGNSDKIISIYPQFLEDLSSQEFSAELMSMYNIPVTLVAGARDTKSPADNISKMYNALSGMPNADMFKMKILDGAPHSLIRTADHYDQVVGLLHSQMAGRAMRAM